MGTFIHTCLEQLSRHPSKLDNCDWITPRVQQAWQTELSRLGIKEADLPKTLTLIQQALENISQDPRGRWLLAQQQEARSEYELTCREGATHKQFVIDRTFIDQGIRWIVDYKFSAPNGTGPQALGRFLKHETQQYQEQLNQYAQLMAQQSSHPIRLALYFPRVPAWEERPFTP